MTTEATKEAPYNPIYEWVKITDDYCDEGKTIVLPENLPEQVRPLFYNAVMLTAIDLRVKTMEQRLALRTTILEECPYLEKNFDHYFKSAYRTIPIKQK